MKKYVDKDALQDFATKLHTKQKTIFATKNEVGTPLVASIAADMTDQTKIYVYVGSESGYTAGNWYYYDGSAWASGGVYNSAAVQTDDTLSVAGMAADAKSAGDAIAEAQATAERAEAAAEDAQTTAASVDAPALWTAINANETDLSFVRNSLGTFLKSYVVTGKVKFDKNTILKSEKSESGTYTWYKFTKNFFVIPDQDDNNGITITHNSDGKMVLNGTASANTMITVELPTSLTGQFYGYISGASTAGIYVYLRNSSSIAATMDLTSATSSSFDRNVSGIVRYQLLILSGASFTDYVLEAAVEYLYTETHANNPYYWEKPTAIAAVQFPVMSDVDYWLSAITTSQILLDVEFLSGKQIVRVSKTGGADYTTILEALKSTPDYVKIYVENGTYNIVDEYKAFYGNSFWTNYDGYSGHPNDMFYRGLWVSDYREIEFDAWAKVVWDYDGTNVAVNGYFSVFATGQNAKIVNAHIIFNANCRYAIHDDFAAFGGTNEFIRCIFDGTSSNGTTIGAGCGHRNTYIIEDCIFLNDGTYDISYHNTSGLGINKIIVNDCVGNGQCKFGWYGSSTEMTDCIASNNKFGSIVCEAHNSSATNENMRLHAWNNIVD